MPSFISTNSLECSNTSSNIPRILLLDSASISLFVLLYLSIIKCIPLASSARLISPLSSRSGTLSKSSLIKLESHIRLSNLSCELVPSSFAFTNSVSLSMLVLYLSLPQTIFDSLNRSINLLVEGASSSKEK